MLNEVYLMSSLPSLSFGQAPPISLEEFSDMARSELSARSFKSLDRVSMRDEEGMGRKIKLKGLHRMHKGLLKDMAEIRNSRMEKRPARLNLLPGTVLEANPLDREMEIIHWQWDYLDALVASKSFTLSEVIVYKLKLQLLFRMHSFNKERGVQVLDSVVNPQKKKEV
jgi:hypothetical protein